MCMAGTVCLSPAVGARDSCSTTHTVLSRVLKEVLRPRSQRHLTEHKATAAIDFPEPSPAINHRKGGRSFRTGPLPNQPTPSSLRLARYYDKLEELGPNAARITPEQAIAVPSKVGVAALRVVKSPSLDATNTDAAPFSEAADVRSPSQRSMVSQTTSSPSGRSPSHRRMTASSHATESGLQAVPEDVNSIVDAWAGAQDTAGGGATGTEGEGANTEEEEHVAASTQHGADDAKGVTVDLPQALNTGVALPFAFILEEVDVTEDSAEESDTDSEAVAERARDPSLDFEWPERPFSSTNTRPVLRRSEQTPPRTFSVNEALAATGRCAPGEHRVAHACVGVWMCRVTPTLVCPFTFRCWDSSVGSGLEQLDWAGRCGPVPRLESQPKARGERTLCPHSGGGSIQC